ncbi:Protein CLEC16A like, partial [Dissostichus eleginoides]
TRLASEVPPARPFSPLSLSARMAKGEQKRGERAHARGLRCGIQRQKKGLGSSIQR